MVIFQTPLCVVKTPKDLFSIAKIVPGAKFALVGVNWGVEQEQLITGQKSDISLSHCIAATVDKLQSPECSMAYFLVGGVLICTWTPPNAEHDCRSVWFQNHTKHK